MKDRAGKRVRDSVLPRACTSPSPWVDLMGNFQSIWRTASGEEQEGGGIGNFLTIGANR